MCASIKIGTVLVAGDFILEHKLAERAGSPGGATPRGTEHFKLESHEAVDTGATKSSVSSMAYRRRLAAELAYAT